MVPNKSPFPTKDIVVSIFLHRNEVAFLLFLIIYFFIFIFLVHWDFFATFGLSLVVVSKGYSPDEVHGLLTAVAGAPVDHQEKGSPFPTVSSKL